MGEMWRAKHSGAVPDDPRRRRGHRATTRVGQPPKPRYFRHSTFGILYALRRPVGHCGGGKRGRGTDAGARLSPFARAAAATLTKPDVDAATFGRDAYECERDTAIAPILLTSLIRPTVPPAVGTSGMNRRTLIVVLARWVIFSGPLRGPTPGGSR